MGAPFRHLRSGRVAVELDERERGVLAQLMRDVAGLLADDTGRTPDRPDGSGTAPGGPGTPDERSTTAPDGGLDVDALLQEALAAPPPQDPAVRRLLPDGSREDPELAESYRRLTESSLREHKRDGLLLASAALGRPEPVVLTPAEAQALLKGLTDVRLVIAERIGLRTDEDAELLHRALLLARDADDAWVTAATVYDALTWWQEALVGALTR
jgi:hypothetical protein